MRRQYFDKLNTDKLADLERQASMLVKAELESVNLSVVGDAKTISKNTTDFLENASGNIDIFSKEAGTLEGTTNVITRTIDNVVEKFSDAKSEVNTVRTLAEDVTNDLKEATKIQNAVVDMLVKLEESAEELGVSVNDIQVFKDLEKQDNSLETFINFAAKRLDRARVVVDDLVDASKKVNKISPIQ